MSTAMLVYDHKLSYKDFHLGICDEFSDGVYLPKEKQIILCSNTLTNRKDFENALYRQLIKFYDDLRSDNYNFNSWKHLACSEVRAAGFSNKCNMTFMRMSKLKSKQSMKEKLDADNYCLKTVAAANLREKPQWAKHADEFVNNIFERWVKDHAPFGDHMLTKTRSLTDIL